MKIKELLQETPLPDDWDKSTYSNNNSFAKRVQYAKERAKRMGTGSSRIAFEIDYEGRKTILKIAKNKKGLDQNEYEAGVLGDYIVGNSGLTIPMIDFDEDNEPATWIHIEKAEKMRAAQFRKFFNGMNPKEMLRVAKYMAGKDQKLTQEVNSQEGLADKYEEIWNNNETINELTQFIGNYDIDPDDFGNISNWGVYKNQPVIIDVGLGTEVAKDHYS